eukprot:12924936-Alexandrium_andersonii.AAC.1
MREAAPPTRRISSPEGGRTFRGRPLLRRRARSCRGGCDGVPGARPSRAAPRDNGWRIPL